MSLFERYDKNPIISPENFPYKVSGVFNPGAIKFGAHTILLPRVEDLRGFSHFCVAKSKNGIDNWSIERNPALECNSKYNEEKWGIEDPRIVYMKDEEKYLITYVSFSQGGPVVSLMSTKDFHNFNRHGAILPPEDKDASLFPEKFDGLYALIHRPIVRGQAHIWISFSPDLRYWGDSRVLIPTRPGWWDSHHVGLGTQPIKTKEGWLIVYHGARITASGALYRVGLVLLDLHEPWKVLRRSKEWVLGPEKTYEMVGVSDAVVFPTGAVYEENNDKLLLYYGAADYSVCLAEGNMSEILEFLMRE